jgi:hypothetical protein
MIKLVLLGVVIGVIAGSINLWVQRRFFSGGFKNNGSRLSESEGEIQLEEEDVGPYGEESISQRKEVE